jgi:hypothetical protein
LHLREILCNRIFYDQIGKRPTISAVSVLSSQGLALKAKNYLIETLSSCSQVLPAWSLGKTGKSAIEKWR